MSKIPKAVLEWVESQQGKHVCICGCGQYIQVLPYHFYQGVARLHCGHNRRKDFRATDASKWVKENQGKHFCQCGCGGTITIKIHHHTRGVPRFLNHHAVRVTGVLLHRKREKNSRFKGGRNVNDKGYVVILTGTTDDGRSVYKLEHRLVMEKILGRKLSPKESIHHKDGDRANNDSSNLELWASKHKSGQRVTDLIAASSDLLLRYASDETLWPENVTWIRDLLLHRQDSLMGNSP